MPGRHQPDLFTPPAPPPASLNSGEVLEGEVALVVGSTTTAPYRWKLYLDRVDTGGRTWAEQLDKATDAPMPPSFAFGVLYRPPGRADWTPVRSRPRVWSAWRVVRDLEAVRDALGDRLLPARGTP